MSKVDKNRERGTLGTRGFFSRATGSFVSSATGREVFGRRPKTRAAKPREKTFRVGHFLRLDRNGKPRMKSLWHPGYERGYSATVLASLSNENADVPDVMISNRKFDVSLDGTLLSHTTNPNAFV